ncbi:hypothetical protein GQ457_11G016660 [Hibiscus cannabinus]
MRSSGHLPSWISTLFGCMGGCFGCFEPSKGVAIQGWKGKSFSEDFWSSSTCELEYSALRSQRSIPSISITSPLDLSGSTSHPSEFVNHGLHLWNQTRQQWVGNKKSEKRAHRRDSTSSCSCNWNVLYHSVRGSDKPLPHPVPLSELVDFLDDVWEQEGLYD